MKVVIAILLAVLVVGCQTRYHTSCFYSPDKTQVTHIDHNGFQFEKFGSWLHFVSSDLDDSKESPGTEISIRGYEWSPIIHLNILPNSVRWQEDLPRMNAEIIRRSKLQDIRVSEELTHYNKFTGHGIRKAGKSDSYRFEYVVFYPEEMPGTRLIVILCGSPNKASLREMDEIIDSVSYYDGH
ncbi:MAG: hypothetical protein WDN00_00980 [Limisphaerales bacterium]